MAWTEELPPDRNGVVRYRGVYRLADGRKRRKTWDHKRAALRWATAEEQKVVDGSTRDPAKGRMRWEAWCDTWWPSRKLEPGALRSQVSMRDNHVLPKWGDTPLNEITHLAVQSWVNKLTPGLSSSSARQCFYLLSASMKAAVRAGLIDTSPCFGVRLPTLPPAPERYLTDDEIDTLFFHFDGVYRLLVELLLETGLRLGEAVALHLHRIDFEAKTIEVVEVWDQYQRVIKSYGKGKRRRTVPLTPHLEALLTEWVTKHPPKATCGFEHAKGSRCRSDVAMPGPRGAIIDPHNFTGVKWKNALADSGIGHARPHDLRHTYASRLVTAGVPMARVQKLLGHDSITTTARYSHLSDEGHDEVLAALAKRAQGAPERANRPTDLDAARQRKRTENTARPAKTRQTGRG